MSTEFFSRDEVLGGLPSRRASTALFSIEAQAAHLHARAQRAMARFATPQSVQAEERAFLEALTRGRDLPVRPTIQILERFAPDCSALIPTDPGVRAALAHSIAEKYGFERGNVPQLRQALGWDDPSVQAAYVRAYARPLETVYAARLSVPARARWAWAKLAFRLEHLPPVLTAFALTLTETVGASILALPIALADVGAIAGVVLLIVLGLVNILTIVGISEATIRNGNSRYWSGGYLTELAASYLGGGGATIFTLGLVILIFVMLIAYYVGVATTLADATGIREEAWALGLFLVNLYFLRRQSLNATIAVALVVGIINIALVLALAAFALPHLNLSYLMHVNLPFVNGRPLDPSLLKLIFGVVLLAYFGHTSTANCARVVLRREPTGRALIQGNIAAMVVAMVLYCIWTITINGSLAPAALSDPKLRSTVLPLLADQAGGVAQVIGSLYVVLGMGMASTHFSLGLYNQVRQWMPTQLLRRVLDARSQFWLGASPVIATFALIEYMLFTNRGTYSGTLGFLGVLKGSLLGGLFPILMLAASRRKGEYVPGFGLRALDHRAVMIGIYLLFLTGIFLHGLVIWQGVWERLAALAIGVVALAMPIAFIRGGIFKPRATIECRAEQLAGDHAVFNVTANGNWLPTQVSLKYADHEKNLRAASGDIADFSALGAMTVTLPPTSARELKVWVHHINVDEVSGWLPAKVKVSNHRGVIVNELIDREQILPLDGGVSRIEIQFLPSEEQMLAHHEASG